MEYFGYSQSLLENDLQSLLSKVFKKAYKTLGLLSFVTGTLNH